MNESWIVFLGMLMLAWSVNTAVYSLNNGRGTAWGFSVFMPAVLLAFTSFASVFFVLFRA